MYGNWETGMLKKHYIRDVTCFVTDGLACKSSTLTGPGHGRGRPTDVYALGACLFTFVYGRIPFSAPSVYQLFQARPQPRK